MEAHTCQIGTVHVQRRLRFAAYPFSYAMFELVSLTLNWSAVSAMGAGIFILR